MLGWFLRLVQKILQYTQPHYNLIFGSFGIVGMGAVHNLLEENNTSSILTFSAFYKLAFSQLVFDSLGGDSTKPKLQFLTSKLPT